MGEITSLLIAPLETNNLTAKGDNYPSIYLSNYYENTSDPSKKVFKALNLANFSNSIVYGNKNDEIEIDSLGDIPFNYKFNYCLIKGENLKKTASVFHFENIVWNKNPKFKLHQTGNFELDTLSAAIDVGDISIGNLFPLDLNNKSRISDKAPDMGAYEH